MQNYKELVILIAEDDDGHAELIQEGLKDSGVRNGMIRFSDGEKVMHFLTSNEANWIRDTDKNFLLLLDINMPRMDGLEVLRRMKSNEAHKEIPVIMLTTTDDPREVEACYRLGCNAYVAKPVNFTDFTATLSRLGLFLQIIKV